MLARIVFIGASLSEPHTSERFRTVNHSRLKTENYENSKYRSYSEPCHGVRARKYHATSKYCSYGEPCHGVYARKYHAISKYGSYGQPCHGVCARKYHAISKYGS